MVAAVWWALTRHGAPRILALVLAVAAPFLVLVQYARNHATWIVALSAVLWLSAVAAGRTALVHADRPAAMPDFGGRPFVNNVPFGAYAEAAASTSSATVSCKNGSPAERSRCRAWREDG